jgi:hypothetical protein
MTTPTSPEDDPSTEAQPQTVTGFVWQLPAGIRIGYGLGLAALVTCLVIAFLMRPRGEWWFNVLVCLFGMAGGWTIGVLLSPMTAMEETKFTGFAKALSAFLTGFVVAKFDLLLKNVSFTVTDPEVTVGRILLLATTFIVGFQSTFMARWTTRPNAGQGKRPWKFLRARFKV